MFDIAYHDYVRAQGFQQSGHHYVTICPFCRHHNRRFYITIVDGLYKCFHCNKAGKWFVVSKIAKVDKDLAEKFHSIVTAGIKALHSTREGHQYGLQYLINTRGLSYDIIKYFQLGYDPVDNSIIIPTIYNKIIYSVDKRFISPSSDVRYLALPGSIKIPYNLDYLHLGGSSCLITEGQIDCISGVQLIPNLVTIGLPGKELKLDKYIPLFNNFERIYLALDMGEETISNVIELAHLLKSYRCYRVVYPAKDLNDLLKQPNAKDTLIQALLSAKRLGTPLIARLQDLLPEIYEAYTGEYRSISTGFEMLDAITGGHRPGELTVLLGASGKGKSTLAATLAINMARQGYKTLFGSFELSFCGEVLPKILSFITQENREVNKLPWDQYKNMVNVLNTTDSLRILSREGVTPLRDVIDAIHLAYKDKVRFVILDHLHYFVKADKDERLHLVAAMKELKQLTRIYPDLMLFLVVHCANPPKDWRTGKSLHLTMYNAKGASDIHQEPDNFWTLNQDNHTNIIDLTVEKLRSNKTNLIAGGNCKVYFDKSKFQYTFV